MKKKTDGAGRKEEKKKIGNERDNNHGSSCGAGNAACSSSSRTDCAWCGAKEGSIPGILKHHQCARCKLTFYCSKNCQRRHWREGGHKQNCVAPADRRASAALDAARIVEKAKSEHGHSQSVKASAAGGKGTTAGGDDIKQNKGEKKRQAAGDNKAAADADDENDECAMCLESLASAKVLKLPCSHVYHAQCVGKLREFGIKQVCPLCRADLPPGPEQLFDDATRRYMVLYRRYNQGTVDASWRIRSVEDRGYAGKMVHMLEEAADQGHAEAQYILGLLYSKGQGVAQDYAAAMKWYRMPADPGDVPAQYHLGHWYRNGQGVAQDYSAAMKWYRMAADQGDAQAQYNLGEMYYEGHGVAQDYSAAMKWYRMAADQGHAGAQGSLGVMYYGGKGVPQNTSEALRLLHKAQLQGYDPAKQGIELIMQAMRETRASQQTNNPSMPPPPPASPVPIGTSVELHGLKAKPQLNGQYGIVVGYVASSSRCTVALEGAPGKTETKMNIKPENLTWK